MTDEPKKIVLSERAKKDLAEIPQEDRAELMKEFIKAVQNGTLLEKSEPVDMEKLKEEDPELYAMLMKSMDESEQGKDE